LSVPVKRRNDPLQGCHPACQIGVSDLTQSPYFSLKFIDFMVKALAPLPGVQNFFLCET
jgi:hypothetical protein